ncbi:ABC transporter permease [Sphingomonas sp. BK580]|uniref:cell division protein FtsX n=1 Tax=Sphingomonas sp. BK580 TaxID=2586972 RepID=UPI001609EE56|nr:permease [Sphingomonas sp. BK580]MBB3693842.1 cell division transport system permease protein [Sphingomonas sp. BK580]
MSAATARVLDPARAGRAMVGVLAIMLFLTLLAAAAGIAAGRGAAALGARLSGRATVQFTDADPTARATAAARALATLRSSPAVTRARAVPRAELAALVAPWLGSAADDPDLPMPELIDLELAPGDAALATARAVLARAAPGAVIDSHGAAVAPLARLLRLASVLAAAVGSLMVAASAAVVVLAARAGLEAHRATIAVMHGLGATDTQVAGLFQRRVARDAAAAAVVASAAAAVTAALLVGPLAAGSGALGDTVALGAEGWGVLAMLPLVFVGFAALVARRTVTHALARTL